MNALRGNPGHRPVNAEEPMPTALASVAAPGWLHADARATWEQLAPELQRLGLLTVLDAHALAAACRWWAIYRRADRALQRRTISTTPSNGRGPVAELAIALKAYDAAMGTFRRFGVTPAERMQLHTPHPKELANAGSDKDPHDELEERRRARRPHASNLPGA